jgi:hypothetical protein
MNIDLNATNCARVKELQKTLAARGKDSINVNELINAALDAVPDKFWEEKLNDLTPLIWKFEEALKDPEKEKALRQLLYKNSKKAAVNKIKTLKDDEQTSELLS